MSPVPGRTEIWKYGNIPGGSPENEGSSKFALYRQALQAGKQD